MQSSSPQLAGLYGLQVSGASAGIIYAKTEPVGALTTPMALKTLGGSDSVSLKLADVAYPTPLASLQGIVTEGAGTLQPLAAAGTYQFMASAGTPQLYVWPQVGNGGQGAYTAYASDSTGTLLDTAQPVLDSTHFGYAFTPPQPLVAGSYTLGLNAYAQLPAFSTLGAVAVQQATTLGQAQGSGASTTFNAQAGTATVLVFPTLAAAADESLFGVVLVAATSDATVLNATQGVGALFSSSTVNITTPGNYLLQATDLQFPAQLSNFYVVLTSGQSVVAQILLGGKSTFTVNAAGTYGVNVLTQVGTGVHYGLYGLSMTEPPAPTISLAANPMSVVSGGMTTLTWSSANTTSCTASGAWSGSLATSGSQQSVALTSPGTFNLSCTGDGGSVQASVQVAITQQSSSHGGGALDERTVLALLMLTLGVLWQRTRRVGPS
jgi:hypothetical protein